MSIKIYHNTRCKNSRAGLAFLQKETSDFEIIEYLKTGLSISELKKITQQLNLKVEDIIRTQETIYKKELKGKKFTEEEWFQIISDNLKLLKRPIILKGNKAIFAESEEIVKSIF